MKLMAVPGTFCTRVKDDDDDSDSDTGFRSH